jgi:magnesium and cobalt transporter
LEDGSSQGLVRKLKSFFRRLTNGFSAEHFEEEIQELIDQGAERGVISPGESEMIQSIFELGETVAREIMVPRTSMVAVSSDATLGQAIDIILNNGHTRLPSMKTIRSYRGILIAKDLLPYWAGPWKIRFPGKSSGAYPGPEVKKIMDLLAS